jgi:hypothetical protein
VNIELPEDGSVALTAPGESIFDNEQGTAKIGFSLTEGTFFKDDMPFATLMFKKLQNKMAALSFFDARTHGHTDVLTFYEGELRSVLSDETHEPLVIETVE